MFSSCSGPGPTFGRCCAHWSLGETRSGRRLPAAPHACECEALDRGNKGSKMRTVSFLVSSSQDMDPTGVWPSVRAVRSAVRGPPTRRWYRVPALLRWAVLTRFGEGGQLPGEPVSQLAVCAVESRRRGRSEAKVAISRRRTLMHSHAAQWRST